MRELVLRYLAGRRGTGAGGGHRLLDAVNAGDGFAFAETKALEAGVQRTHMEEEKKDRSRREDEGGGSGGEDGRAIRWGKAKGAGRVLCWGERIRPRSIDSVRSGRQQRCGGGNSSSFSFFPLFLNLVSALTGSGACDRTES